MKFHEIFIIGQVIHKEQYEIPGNVAFDPLDIQDFFLFSESVSVSNMNKFS